MEQFPARQAFDDAVARRARTFYRCLFGPGKDDVGQLASKAGFEVLEEHMATERVPVCLCRGQSKVTPIAQNWRNETDDQASRLLGIGHRICGGQFRVKGSGPNRLRLAKITRKFGIRGQKLAERHDEL